MLLTDRRTDSFFSGNIILDNTLLEHVTTMVSFRFLFNKGICHESGNSCDTVKISAVLGEEASC